jgi:FMN phosphatase YigB (HAD superfamily)
MNNQQSNLIHLRTPVTAYLQNSLPEFDDRKTILTDVDGVITSWQSGLPFFLNARDMLVNPAIQNILNEVYLKPSELFIDKHGTSISDSDAIKLFEEYNTSDYIRTLPAYIDALDVVNRLGKHYKFIAISALCNNTSAYNNRLFNLDSLFPNIFDSLHLSGPFNSKSDIFTNLIHNIGHKNIVCYVDDRVCHLDEFDKSWTLANGKPPNLLFQMNRRPQSIHTDLNTVQVSNWYQIEEKLCRM